MKYKIILILFTLFVCCSDDNQIEEVNEQEAFFKKAIIGSWAYDTVKVDGVTYKYGHTQDCEKDYFQFYNQEGKLFEFQEQVILNCANCAKCASSGTGLRWELNSDNINLYFGEQLVLVYKIIEVTETTLRYQVNLDFDEDGVEDELEISAVYYDPFNDFD